MRSLNLRRYNGEEWRRGIKWNEPRDVLEDGMNVYEQCYRYGQKRYKVPGKDGVVGIIGCVLVQPLLFCLRMLKCIECVR